MGGNKPCEGCESAAAVATKRKEEGPKNQDITPVILISLTLHVAQDMSRLFNSSHFNYLHALNSQIYNALLRILCHQWTKVTALISIFCRKLCRVKNQGEVKTDLPDWNVK